MQSSFDYSQLDWELRAYDNLAKAIVMQAARDYMRALARLRKKPGDEKAMRTKEDCERFFFSRMFGLLTTLDGYSFVAGLQHVARSASAPKRKKKRVA